MRIFDIKKPDEGIRSDLIHKINNLTKPKGALGTLEELALRIGLIQQTTSPVLRNPHNIIFGADHGIADEGVSVSPKEVTWQQMGHFIKGGGGINFLCQQHGFTLKVVDAGVDFDFPKDCGVIDKKVRKGTRNYLYEGAMTVEEFDTCITHGADVVVECWKEGCNVVSFGEMGIGNTSSSSLLMTCLTGIPLEKCVGAGSGLDNAGIRHKLNILQQALDKYKGNTSCVDYMCYFGGLEMAMAVGGMLQAAEKHMVILVDGFIMTNCIWVAAQIYPEVMDYAIFGHQGDEAGHKLLLEKMGAKPLLNLGLRLGEGSGAVCAYPIVDSAVRMINEMDTFDKASITKYF